jgi:hypothetical protein
MYIGIGLCDVFMKVYCSFARRISMHKSLDRKRTYVYWYRMVA